MPGISAGGATRLRSMIGLAGRSGTDVLPMWLDVEPWPPLVDEGDEAAGDLGPLGVVLEDDEWTLRVREDRSGRGRGGRAVGQPALVHRAKDRCRTARIAPRGAGRRAARRSYVRYGIAA